MKPPREWDEDYLLSLPSLEPTDLDFKGRGGLDLTLPNVIADRVKNELSVELSAFANSGGGLIVFGVKNPTAGQPLEIDDGGVDIAMKGSSTKEWLENVIPFLTDYSLPSFEIHVIEGKKSDSQILPGRAVFVVEVPDSERAPHQAKDHRYYVRLGGASQSIGHQFVMDIAGRRQYPILAINLRLHSNLDYSEEDNWQALPIEASRYVALIVTMQNVGHIYAQYVNCFLYVPKELISPHLLSQKEYMTISNETEYYTLEVDNSSRTGTGARDFHIILPQLAYEHIEESLLANFKQSGIQTIQKEIRWQVYADNAPPREGKILINDIPIFSREGKQVRPIILK